MLFCIFQVWQIEGFDSRFRLLVLSKSSVVVNIVPIVFILSFIFGNCFNKTKNNCSAVIFWICNFSEFLQTQRKATPDVWYSVLEIKAHFGHFRVNLIKLLSYMLL